MKIFEMIKKFFRKIGEKYDAWKSAREEKKTAKVLEQLEWDKEHPYAAETKKKIRNAVPYVAALGLCVGLSVACVALGIDMTPPSTEECLRMTIDSEVHNASRYGITSEERQEHLRAVNDSLAALNRLQRINNPGTPDTTISVQMGA